MNVQTVTEARGRVRRATRPRLELEHRADGQLFASLAGECAPVWVCHCFPWSAPGRLVSLRDQEDEEFALVRDPEELDADSRFALERALAEADFVLEIERIEACEEEVEIRSWKVVTRQGRRSFQTRRDDWPRELPDGALLIRDVAGDLFLIREPDALDAGSRELLWVFVD